MCFVDDFLVFFLDIIELNIMLGIISDLLFVVKFIWGVLYGDGKVIIRWKRFFSDIVGDFVSKLIVFVVRFN